MFSTANTTPSTTRFTTPLARIDSFSSWLEAWNICIATVVAHNPSRASELLGYQHLIHLANKHFCASAWLNYDVQLRTLGGSNPQFQWNLHHSELWLKIWLPKPGHRHIKLIGLAHIVVVHTYHFPGRYPHCPFRLFTAK